MDQRCMYTTTHDTVEQHTDVGGHRKYTYL